MVSATQAEEMEKLMMKLAKVASSERPFVEDCGGALSKTYKSQVSLSCCPILCCLFVIHQMRNY